MADAVDRAGFTKFHVLLLLLAGAVWAADAMEMMLLSFIGPAVACEWGLTGGQEGEEKERERERAEKAGAGEGGEAPRSPF